MIIDLQRRLAEVGRIRIGQQVASGKGSRPAKLDTFRLTSADRTKIGNAAQLYGGEVAEWQAPAGNQWEVVTAADSLSVIVPPADMAFTQWYELWSAGGCQRRCDGVTESISDGRCLCDGEDRECSIHSRLSVMLADLPGLGVWRIDTSGYYAAVELQAAVEVVQMAAGRGQMLPAQLRLEQRMVKRDGKTRRFAVPVLDIAVSPAQLLSGGPVTDHTAIEDGRRFERDNGFPPGKALTPVPDTVPQRPAASIADQAKAEQKPKKRSNAQQPVPRTGLRPRTVEEAKAHVKEALPSTLDPDEAHPGVRIEERLITDQQLKKLSILLKEQGFEDRESRHGFVIAAINRPIESSKDLTLAEASAVIDILENTSVPPGEQAPDGTTQE
jgi:hypothetical protein